MKVLAIDPGYERLGIAVLEQDARDNKERLVFSECFQTPASAEFTERLGMLGEEVESFIIKYAPKALAIENLFFNTNQKTAMRVAEVRGALLYIAKKHGLDIYEYTPPQIKTAVCGNGRGSKKDVIAMLNKLITIDKEIRYDDEYDAIATGLTCFASQRL